jgi:hypothetical protein
MIVALAEPRPYTSATPERCQKVIEDVGQEIAYP